MELNGEVAGGPLDAFFMSRPRYTPGCTSMVQLRLRPSIETFPPLSILLQRRKWTLAPFRTYPKPYHSPVHPRGSESSPISPRFERNSTFSLPFISRRPISGRRVDLLLALPCSFCLSLNLLFSITRFPRHGSRHKIPLLLLFVWTLLTRSSIARFYRDTRFCRVRGMINWIETRKFCFR